MRCPYVKCNYEKIIKSFLVRSHLLQYEFKINYYVWVDNGEEFPNEDNLPHASSSHGQSSVDRFDTSAKRLKEYSLLSAGLRLNAFVKNAVAFLKLI